MKIDYKLLSQEDIDAIFENGSQQEINAYLEWQEEYIKSEYKNAKSNLHLNASMSENEVIDKVLDVALILSSNDPERYNLYKEIFDMIPPSYRLDVLIKVFYEDDFIHYLSFYEYLHKALRDEPLDRKKERTDKIKTILASYINENNTITIYRGATSSSVPIDIAVSWTLDENKALFFANRFPGERARKLYTAVISIDDVDYYSDSRNEKEVIISSFSSFKHVTSKSIGTKRPRRTIVKD